MPGSTFPLEVQPRIPPQLSRLPELANDLVYSWERTIRSLFHRLDRDLWEACGHNPKAFLRRVSQHRLDDALEDRSYMEDYRRVTTAYDSYRDHGARPELAKVARHLVRTPGRRVRLLTTDCVRSLPDPDSPIVVLQLGIGKQKEQPRIVENRLFAEEVDGNVGTALERPEVRPRHVQTDR